MKKSSFKNPIHNSSGFIVAEFLFAFVMVLGIGIFIFALTFSLATIEVSQYIVWSAARNYSVARTDEAASRDTATRKFQNLAAKFPLLTGVGATSNPWFELSDFEVGDLGLSDLMSEFSADDIKNQNRQPWTGARAKIKLKLFSGLRVPFLGKVAEDPSTFEFPIRAFIIRHPSRAECYDFFYRNDTRYQKGIRKLEKDQLATQFPTVSPNAIPSGLDVNGFGEDNGC